MNQNELTEIKDQFSSTLTVCEQMVELFHVLSNKPRFRIACMLTHGEACVQDIAYVIGEGTMSNISQQLKILRLAGVIQKRRDKKQILYSLTDDRVANLISFLRTEYNQSQECSIPHQSTDFSTAV